MKPLGFYYLANSLAAIQAENYICTYIMTLFFLGGSKLLYQLAPTGYNFFIKQGLF